MRGDTENLRNRAGDALFCHAGLVCVLFGGGVLCREGWSHSDSDAGRFRRVAPGGQRAERVVHPGVATHETLQLPAGRLWDGASRNEGDAVQLDAVLFGDGLPQLPDELMVAAGRDLARVDLRNQRDAVAADVAAHRNCGDAADPYGPVPAFGSPFEVLRKMLRAADDEQVLDAAGDVQLSVAQRTEIAGSQPAAVAGVEEHLRRFERPVPVTTRDARPAHLNLSRLVTGSRCLRQRIDDPDAGAGRR